MSYRDPKDTEKYYANDEMWETAQRMLREVVEEAGLPFYEAEGEAAFYGPKLDVQIKTVLGKEETLSTVQIDFLLPERFELEYIGDDGQKHRPVVLHRGILGTMERFVAFLLENFAGSLPLWLSPQQVKVIPVSTAFDDYAKEVTDKLRRRGISAEADLRNEKLGYKIREAQLEKLPYMFVVGENEMNAQTVSIRKRGEGDIGAKPLQEVIELLSQEIADRVIS
ncbi:Threonine--tRNA ligase 1 [compost metagenome]